jgi:hypothetical protein
LPYVPPAAGVVPPVVVPVVEGTLLYEPCTVGLEGELPVVEGDVPVVAPVVDGVLDDPCTVGADGLFVTT